MKKLILIGIAMPLLFSCGEKLSPTATLFEKDFAVNHKEWKIVPDTFKKDTLIGYKDIEIPVRLCWLAAIDSANCHRIAYFKFERLPSNSAITVKKVRASSVDCATKWESDDQRRFETLLFSGVYEAKKGIKKYTFDGLMGKISGIGESEMNQFKK